MSKNNECNFTKVVRRANTITHAQMLCFYRKPFVISITCSFRQQITGFQLRSKLQDWIKNLKISVDSAFSFWAIEPKQKRGIGEIFRKGHFRRRESDQSHLLLLQRISFIYKLLAKIWGKRDLLKHRRWLVKETWKLCCFGRKTSKWYPL